MDTLRSRQKRWLGHILRHDSLLRITLEGRIQGEKGCERPRTMFLDWLLKMEEDNISYDELKMLAQDRLRWCQWRWKPAIYGQNTTAATAASSKCRYIKSSNRTVVICNTSQLTRLQQRLKILAAFDCSSSRVGFNVPPNTLQVISSHYRSCQALKDNSWSVHQVKGQSHQAKPSTR